MIAAPALIPLNPLGAKPLPPGTSGWPVQFSGLMSQMPTVMKKRISPIFRITIALLVLADSFTPRTRTTVMAMTTRNAGRLKMIGIPAIRGARVTAEAT